MATRHEIKFKSYDRLFPNQDTLPKGGFGNLIALPLQGRARKDGNSLFIDENSPAAIAAGSSMRVKAICRTPIHSAEEYKIWNKYKSKTHAQVRNLMVDTLNELEIRLPSSDMRGGRQHCFMYEK